MGTILGDGGVHFAGVTLLPATDAGPILACLFFGFATCMGTVAPPIMVVKEYGKKNLGTVTGIVTAFELLGAAMGAVVSGVMFDAFLSFAPVWIMVIAASVVMGARCWRPSPPRAAWWSAAAEGAPGAGRGGLRDRGVEGVLRRKHRLRLRCGPGREARVGPRRRVIEGDGWPSPPLVLRQVLACVLKVSQRPG
ncbi:MAG: MFS transporter [Gordonibacter pamelaeae]